MGTDEFLMYTEEEREFRDYVRKFCLEVIVPQEDNIQKENIYSKEIIREIGKAGLMSVHHPKEIGIGKYAGKGLVYETIVAEEISAVVAGLDMARMASATLYGKPISRFGTNAQKEKYLKPILSGEKIGALGITEPNVGSDVAGMETHAESNDDGTWTLNGHKKYITNGSQADYLCVFAITDSAVHPKTGMSAFIVENTMQCFNVVKDFDLMGMNGARVSELMFDNIIIPKENILGNIGDGFAICMDELDSERVAIAAEALGYARPALERAIKHSIERVQFDKPIRYFEGVNFKIADMATEFEAARLLTLNSARRYDKGLSISKEAAMAKIFATKMAVDVCDRAIQILGGRGYEKENKVERYYRDAKLMEIGGGTSEILRYLVQREIFKENKKK